MIFKKITICLHHTENKKEKIGTEAGTQGISASFEQPEDELVFAGTEGLCIQGLFIFGRIYPNPDLGPSKPAHTLPTMVTSIFELLLFCTFHCGLQGNRLKSIHVGVHCDVACTVFFYGIISEDIMSHFHILIMLCYTTNCCQRYCIFL